MNQYQKLATFLLRLVGAVVALVGVMGPLYVVVATVFGSDTPSYGNERWWGSFLWAAGGIFLVVFSKPLGRLFGRGLD